MRSTYLSVSARALEHNARAVRTYLPKNVRLMAIVKADAYGHGAVYAANAFMRGGADALAVAIVEEAAILRKSGINIQILILGGADRDSIEEAVRLGVSQAVYTPEMLDDMQRAAEKTGVRAKAHFKIDTGMSRVGIRGIKEMTVMLDKLRECPLVDMEGIFTHFCSADDDPEFTAKQDFEFWRAIDAARGTMHNPIAHAAASPALMDLRYMHDMVRPGLALYGFGDEKLGLIPAQEIVSRPVRVEKISAGDSVSYGRTFIANRDTLVMTVPIGYGDGYPRSLSNKSRALVDGVSAPLIGRVCMDMLMLDVTDVPTASMESEIVLMGRRGNEEINAAELAKNAGTISYEVMLGFSQRVRRVELP